MGGGRVADQKQDLRIRKTQRALEQAMIALLERHRFSEITVNDICQEAMVSRSAFYAHFDDKYALVQFCMDVLRREVFEEAEALDFEGRLRCVLENIKSHARIIKNLVMGEVDRELKDMMHRSFERDFGRAMADRGIGEDDFPGPLDVIVAYYAAGVTSAILHWLDKGMPYTTERMATTLNALIFAPKPLI